MSRMVLPDTGKDKTELCLSEKAHGFITGFSLYQAEHLL